MSVPAPTETALSCFHCGLPMRDVSKSLSDAEIDALAAHYSGAAPQK